MAISLRRKQMLNKLSLRLRLTLLTGSILFVTLLLLTLVSIYNAKDKFTRPIYYLDSISIENSEHETIRLDEFNFSMESIDQSNNYRAKIDLQEAQRQFDIWSYIYLIIISGIGMIATYSIAGRILKPVHELSVAINEIEERNLSKRLLLPPTNDEIYDLTQSFNNMLSRLEQSFSYQKQFAAHAAHELKTPLAITKTSLQVLKLDDSPSVEDYEETFMLVEQSNDRLIKVVEQLLELSKEDNALPRESISLDTLINCILTELSPLLNEKNIEVDINLNTKMMTGSPTLIHRALFNLIENAIKYNHIKGRIDIKSVTDRDGIQISVADSGIGISPDDLPYIFEPFYRVDKSRNRQIAGSGLGLALVKNIIGKHGGEVGVDSHQMKGTIFIIHLPSEDN